MSAAHETLTLKLGGEGKGTGVPGFGGLTVSDQLRGESRWCLRGWCCHLDGSTSQAAHHTSPRLGSISNVGKQRKSVLFQSARALVSSKRTKWLKSDSHYFSGGRASCARSLKPLQEKERKYRHRAATVCRFSYFF